MAERSSAEALLELWKRQMEEGTRAWTQSLGQAQTADPSQVWRPILDQGIAAWASLMAQAPANPDLMAQWKQFLDQWIAAWGEALERAMGTEAFAQALGRYLEQWLSVQAPVQRGAAQAAEATLTALGMPSRSEVMGISRRISDLDDRLEGIADQLQALALRLERVISAGDAPRRAPSGRTPQKKKRR